MDLQSNDVSVDNFEECELDEDSSQVAVFIAGYITKKFLKKSQCEACLALLLKGDSSATEYVNSLSKRRTYDTLPISIRSCLSLLCYS